MTYQDLVKKHMASYTTSEINDAVKGGEFRGKNYPHILKKQNERLNILPQYREEIFEGVMKNIKPHMYFHHLNSSQAMCINFFYPLVKNNLMSVKLGEINPKGNWGDMSVCNFEKLSDDELALKKSCPGFGEPTNFDFYLETLNGYEVSFEIKYTEAEFGKAEKEKGVFCSKYNPKYEAYQSMMKPWIIKNRDKTDFLNNYQLMRNLLFLQDSKRYVVFLIPKDNKKVAKQAEATKDWISDEMRDHVVVLHWEDLLPIVKTGGLNGYYQEFYEKYLNL